MNRSIVVLLVLVASANASAGEAAGGSSGGDSAALYAQHCSFCHGVKGAGDGVAAGMLKPPPTAFSDREYWQRADRATLAATIRGGKVGTAMIPFADRFDEKQAAAMVDYLATLAPGDSK